MIYEWSDAEFNGNVNSNCFKQIGAIAIKLWIVL